MRVTVLGGGSWGTTVAALLCRRDHDVLLWARNPEVAAEVNEQRTNEAYLPGARLPARLRATEDLERARRRWSGRIVAEEGQIDGAHRRRRVYRGGLI